MSPGSCARYISAKGPEPIFDSAAGLQRRGVHVEITDLIVPRVGESVEATRKLARYVADTLGPSTPFHLLRFHPDYKMMDLPETPVKTLEKLHAVARAEGLEYVYLGNIWGHPLEHTYCSACGAIAVRRYGFTIQAWNLDERNRCRRLRPLDPDRRPSPVRLPPAFRHAGAESSGAPPRRRGGGVSRRCRGPADSSSSISGSGDGSSRR